MKEHTQAQEEEWMEYLRAHPKKAKELIREAQKQDIEVIKEKYSDVIRAYAETKSKLDSIIANMVSLKDYQKREWLLDEDEWSTVLQQATEDGEKEWDRLCYEFHVNHGRSYDAYEQEVAAKKATYKELMSLLLKK